jgi:hypothetical protein
MPSRAERIAKGKDARVEQTDDIAGYASSTPLRARPAMKLCGLRACLNELVRAGMPDVLSPSEYARTHAHQGDAVAVRGVHVRLYLEDRSLRSLRFRAEPPLVLNPSRWAARKLDEMLKKAVNAEVVHGLPKNMAKAAPFRTRSNQTHRPRRQEAQLRFKPVDKVLFPSARRLFPLHIRNIRLQRAMASRPNTASILSLCR